MFELMRKFVEILPNPVWVTQDHQLVYKNSAANQLSINDPALVEQILAGQYPDHQYVTIGGKEYLYEFVTQEVNQKHWSIHTLTQKELSYDHYSPNILETIIDNVPELIFYKDKEGRYRGINKICREFFNDQGIYEIIGKTDQEITVETDYIKTWTIQDQLVLQTKQPLFIEDKLPWRSDKTKILETIKVPVLNHDGEAWGIVGVARDITSAKTLENRLRYLSYNDMLTGLYNRAYFNETMLQLIQKEQFPIGIVMGDINGLKLVNDTFGHLEGDRLIMLIAEQIKTACTKGEYTFRWGGDEFAIVIPNATEQQCEELIEKIEYLCEQYRHERFTLSISMGSALLHQGATSIDEVLKTAEDKLYRHKMLVSKSLRGSILSSLQQNLHAKNIETEEHTNRVLHYSLAIGKELKLKNETLDELILVARLHDIGMISIPDQILLKTTPLKDDELAIMKTHTERGYRLAMMLPEFSHIARNILTHHEHWDGSGYPLGLAGKEIPLLSRIVTLVDGFDELTTDTKNGTALSTTEALEMIKQQKGKHFDPELVDLFCTFLESNPTLNS